MTDEEKFKRLYRCLNRWLLCAHEGKKLSEFLKEKTVSSVGIYGYGALGVNAVRELLMEQFPILWVADRKQIVGSDAYATFTADEVGSAPQPDAIIISSVTDTEIIEKKLQDLFQCEIITIEELIDCLYEWGNKY